MEIGYKKLLKVIKKSGIKVSASGGTKKIRKKDLKYLNLNLCLADLTPSRLNRKIVIVFENFYFMDANTKNYLKKIYEDAFKYGYSVVDNDSFTNVTWTSYSELNDRFNDHPSIQNEDIAFLEKLKADDNDTMNQIFQRNVAIKGYEEHFIYIIYRNHFIDGSDDMASKIINVPDVLDPEKVLILSQNGYADGVQDRVRELAREAIQADAEEILEEIQGITVEEEVAVQQKEQEKAKVIEEGV